MPATSEPKFLTEKIIFQRPKVCCGRLNGTQEPQVSTHINDTFFTPTRLHISPHLTYHFPSFLPSTPSEVPRLLGQHLHLLPEISLVPCTIMTSSAPTAHRLTAPNGETCCYFVLRYSYLLSRERKVTDH
jgi:hypothetical protein